MRCAVISADPWWTQPRDRFVSVDVVGHPEQREEIEGVGARYWNDIVLWKATGENRGDGVEGSERDRRCVSVPRRVGSELSEPWEELGLERPVASHERCRR